MLLSIIVQIFFEHASFHVQNKDQTWFQFYWLLTQVIQ